MSDEAVQSMVQRNQPPQATADRDDGSIHFHVEATRSQLLAATPDHDGLLRTGAGN